MGLGSETGPSFLGDYGILNKRIETDPTRGIYLEFTDYNRKIVITAFDHNGKVEEIITRKTIKNFNKKNDGTKNFTRF